MSKRHFSMDSLRGPVNSIDDSSERKSDTLMPDDLERPDDYDDIVATPVALIPPDVNTEHHTVRSRIVGFCCGPQPTMTEREKRLQVMKVLSLTLLPILCLWAFTAYSLSDSIEVKMDIEQTQIAVRFSVEIGIFLDRIQRERDMSVLYLTILGPETRSFLQNEYILTDEALQAMSGWPVRNDTNTVFRSKQSFQDFLNDYRNKLDPHTFNIYSTMDFYNGLIEKFVEWLYGSIRESSMASIWKVLVAYQKIVTGMEHIGIERALGTVFFVEGRLPPGWHERYNYRVNIFKANYQSAVFYSHMVDPMYQKLVTRNVESTGHDPVTDIIDSFRYTIQYSNVIPPSITSGQWWFDNMTFYLDQLLVIQQHLGTFINGELQNIIDEEEKNLTISACFLALVILMCPLLVYSLEALTSNIHSYALAVGAKTEELARAREVLDFLQYHKVPSPVAHNLRHGMGYTAEYFKSASILFMDVHDFEGLLREHPPEEVVFFLDTVNSEMEELLKQYDVYKTHRLQDSYMFASGLPLRNSGRHSAILGDVALALLDLVKQKHIRVGQQPVCLRIGMDTGSCLAGVVGKILPRYCFFGDVIRVASKMMHSSLPNKIHVSYSTARVLKRHNVFRLQSRPNVQSKDRDWKRKTFWLEAVTDREELGKILTKRTNPSSTRMTDKLQSHFGIDLERKLTHPQRGEERSTTQDSTNSVSNRSAAVCSEGNVGGERHSDDYGNPDRTQHGKSAPELQTGQDSVQELRSADSTDNATGCEYAWDNKPPEPRRGKGTGRKTIVVEKKALRSTSESSPKHHRILDQAVQPGLEPSSLVSENVQTTAVSDDVLADHLNDAAFKAEAAKEKAIDLTEDQASAADDDPSPPRSDEEAKVCSFSRSSSLDSQLKRKFSIEVESRKGSWPERSLESNVPTSKKPTSEQQVYSVSCLPGTGDVQARLEWEMQQSSWFLQFSKHSVKKQAPWESEGQEDGEYATEKCSTPRDEGAAPGSGKEKLTFAFPITFPTIYRTPANSPSHSPNKTESVVSLNDTDA